jgi:hypothetical protein
VIQVPDGEALGRARDAVATVRSDLPYTDEIVGCIENLVAADQTKLSVVLQGTLVGSEGYSVLVEGGQVCQQRLIFAAQFADSLQASAGGSLTDAQMECLRRSYADLSPADLQALTEAALNRESPNRESQGAALRILVEGCEVTVPG